MSLNEVTTWLVHPCVAVLFSGYWPLSSSGGASSAPFYVKQLHF